MARFARILGWQITELESKIITNERVILDQMPDYANKAIFHALDVFILGENKNFIYYLSPSRFPYLKNIYFTSCSVGAGHNMIEKFHQQSQSNIFHCSPLMNSEYSGPRVKFISHKEISQLSIQGEEEDIKISTS